MTNTIQSATHDINTAFGISIENYFLTTPPPQRSVQDKQTGPPIWAMMGTILLIIMRDKGFGLDAILYFSQWVLVISGLAFVHDTYIINATKSVNTRGEDLIQE